jgi:DnaA family protein
VTEQLVFDLAAPQPASFDNFLPGANAEALAALQALAAGRIGETGLLLWGPPGAGKTHLLRAVVSLAAASGCSAVHVADANSLSADEARGLEGQELVVIDAIDSAGPEAQACLFTLFNTLKDRGGHLLVASRAPLAALALREGPANTARVGFGLRNHSRCRTSTSPQR